MNRKNIISEGFFNKLKNAVKAGAKSFKYSPEEVDKIVKKSKLQKHVDNLNKRRKDMDAEFEKTFDVKLKKRKDWEVEDFLDTNQFK